MSADINLAAELCSGDAGAAVLRKRMRTLTACAELICSDLPQLGRSALALARRYWTSDDGVPRVLLEARVQCWEYLDVKNGDSTTIADREDHAMRALICCLYGETQEPGDCFDSVSFFFEMLNGLGDYSAQVRRIIAAGSPPPLT